MTPNSFQKKNHHTPKQLIFIHLYFRLSCHRRDQAGSLPTLVGFGVLLSLLCDRAGLGAHPAVVPAASALGVLHITWVLTGHGERDSHTPELQNSLFQLKK